MEIIKIKYISLAFIALLVGCKEAEIEGAWYGSEKSFNAGIVKSLFADAKEELEGEEVIVSNLKTEGNTDIFLVTLGEGKHSKEWIEKVLNKVEQRQADNKTAVTVTFTEVNGGKDENEGALLKVLNELKMEQKGSITSNIDWAKSEVVVYTRKLSIMGYTDPYSQYNPSVYCELKVKLTDELAGLEIKSKFPYITSADISDAARASMSEKQIVDHIKEENNLRRFLNVGMQINGSQYPRTVTFSDEFMNKLSERNGILEAPSLSYSLDAQNIHITYGDISNAKFDPISGPILGDATGELHRKCSEMVKEMTPELDKKREDALKYAQVGKMVINPKWKPEN